MSTRMIVEFPDGQQILFGGTGSGTGLSEVGVEEEIAKRTEAAFKSGIGAIGKLVTTLEESVDAMPKRPDKIEMEFGATLSADCKLWIVSGKGDYAFKVKLSGRGSLPPPSLEKAARFSGSRENFPRPGRHFFKNAAPTLPTVCRLAM
jgi:hypothetical protein